MHRVKLRRLSGTNEYVSVGITLPKPILQHRGIIDDGGMTGDYHVFVDYDSDEGVLKVPIPDATDETTSNTPEEALVERERDQQLSPGERDVLADHAAEMESD